MIRQPHAKIKLAIKQDLPVIVKPDIIRKILICLIAKLQFVLMVKNLNLMDVRILMSVTKDLAVSKENIKLPI